MNEQKTKDENNKSLIFFEPFAGMNFAEYREWKRGQVVSMSITDNLVF